MSALAIRSKRRQRRMAVLSALLAVGAIALWLLVWTQVQRNARDAWVAGAQNIGIDVEVAVDKAKSSFLGRVRNLLGLAQTHVYVEKRSQALLLLKAPAGEPRGLIIHLLRGIDDETSKRLTTRFPNAELRRQMGGMGGGIGYF